jgi:hypothetical protein
MSQKNSQVWGIQNYEVPAKYFDHLKQINEKENIGFMLGQKKRPKKELDKAVNKFKVTDCLQQKAAKMPEPWKYDINQKWILGFRSETASNPPTKSRQIDEFKWKNVPVESQVIRKEEKKTHSKLDMSVKKHTFIERIIDQNTNKNYPRPGATDYYLDSLSAKKYYPDKVELVTKKSLNAPTVKTRLPFANQKGKKRLRIFRH